MDTSLTWLGRLVESPTGADWHRMVDVYAPLIHSWTLRAGVIDADREDLVQEVLLVVVKRVKEFEREHPGAFRGWLRSILANHLRNYYRKRPAGKCEFPLEGLTDPNSVLSKSLDREHDEHIVRQLMKLVEKDFKPTTWQAFREQVLEGRTPGDVAAELDVSLSVVIQSKYRVMQRLRQEFAGWFDRQNRE